MAKPNTLIKGRKMDPYTVSSQAWEIQYVASKFCVTRDEVRAARKVVGKSRQKIYNYLGYGKLKAE